MAMTTQEMKKRRKKKQNILSKLINKDPSIMKRMRGQDMRAHKAHRKIRISMIYYQYKRLFNVKY